MRHALGNAIRAALKAHADPAKALEMQRYMKSAMPYYGVNAPTQKLLWRDVFAAHPLDSCERGARSRAGPVAQRAFARSAMPPSR